jgi:acetyltransferase
LIFILGDNRVKDLMNLFAPKSIAIIGASRREGSLGKMFLDAVVNMQFTGEIFPVNPKAKKINHLTCYPDVASLPRIPDLAIILLPKDFVLDTVEMIVQKNIKNIIVISAGFKEVGREGEKLERDLLKLVRSNGIRLIGPNSMGLFNTDPRISLNATFSPTPPQAGHVGFISQSGALGVGILELSKQIGLGFSTFVSTGNKADIGDVDVLQYLKDDINTNVIMLYQESIDSPSRFKQLCNKIVSQKPLLALKAGRTASGLRAASSHTGALASDDRISDVFLAQCGVIRCKTLQELLDSALAFANQPLPRGNRVAVITNAGGPGILASDALEQAGLDLVTPRKSTLNALEKLLPAEAALRNPIDMIASATHEIYYQVCSLLEQDSSIDALFIIIVKPPVNTTPKKIISNLAALIRKSQKPFFCTLMSDIDESSGLTDFHKLGIPVYRYPENAAVALGNMIKYLEIKDRIKEDVLNKYKSNNISKNESPRKTKQASFNEIAYRLKQYKLPLCPYIITQEVEEAISYSEVTGPVVLKIANEQIIHKSDHGFVKINISTVDEVRKAFADIIKRAEKYLKPGTKPAVLVQKMIPSGIELVLGAKRESHFGSVLMFGMGGTFIELYQDVAFRVLPIKFAETYRMINELKAAKIFEGYRNNPPLDRNILAQMIVKFSTMILENSDIYEMDLNPLIWSLTEAEPIIVDSRMTVTV